MGNTGRSNGLENVVIVLSLVYLSSTSGISQLEIPNGEAIPTGSKFFLYARNKSCKEDLLTVPEDLDDSCFNTSLPTMVIIHGYQSHSRHSELQEIKDAVMDAGGYNVVMMDYGHFSMDDYQKVVERAAEAGDQLAELLVRLHNLNLTSTLDTTLVGFSLGAQIAAMAGHELKTKFGVMLGRIIALDPAKPSFDDSVKPEGRLDTEDAKMVLVLHTAGGILAYDQPTGHADFYPNGGVPVQPPCKMNTKQNGYRGVVDALGGTRCSHAMAVQYLTQSIRHPEAFLAIRCLSWDQFNRDECPKPQQLAVFGLHTPESARGRFYLRTSSEPPYGVGEEGVRPAPGDRHDSVVATPPQYDATSSSVSPSSAVDFFTRLLWLAQTIALLRMN